MNETELNKIESMNNGLNYNEFPSNDIQANQNYTIPTENNAINTNNLNQTIDNQNIIGGNDQFNNNMNSMIQNGNLNDIQTNNNFENQETYNVNPNIIEPVNYDENAQNLNSASNDEMVPNMIANPNAEVSAINLNQTEEPMVEESSYIEETVTEEDLELEKRNKNGLRVTFIFGIIIMIFIILLPFLYEIL